MLDLGQAATVAAIAVPLAAITITVIKVRGLSRSARYGGDYNGDKFPLQPIPLQCPEHSGVAQSLKNIDGNISKLWNSVGKIQDDVNRIARSVHE